MLLGRRFAAYILDWLLSLLAAVALASLAGIILLAASNLDRHDPPDWALYTAIVLVCLWLPAWYIYTSLAWSSRGATLGMALMGLCVVDHQGCLPAVWRSAWRAASLALLSLPLLVTPILVALALSLGTIGPAYVAAPVATLLILSTASIASALVAADARGWHDHASGTRIALAPPVDRTRGTG